MGRIEGNLKGMQGEANHANHGLNEIKRARARNRLVLYGVVSLIALAVILVIAVKVT